MRHPLFHYRHIVFDWNGTVIDDVDLALSCVNHVGGDVGLPPIALEKYRQMFKFPICDFYTDLGFDFSKKSFASLISQYLLHFDAKVHDCALCPGFVQLAADLRARGIKLSVLSASFQTTLAESAAKRGIDTYLENLVGLEDTAATGKLLRAQQLDGRLRSTSEERILMIGDTDHDFEVAYACGWDFIAVATGHQSLDHLRSLPVPVFERLDEIALLTGWEVA